MFIYYVTFLGIKKGKIMKVTLMKTVLKTLLPPSIRSPSACIKHIQEAYEADRNLKKFGFDFGGDSSIYRRTVAASEFYLEYGGGIRLFGTIEI